MNTSFKMIFCISFLLVFMQTGFTQNVAKNPVYKSWVHLMRSDHIMEGRLAALNDESILFSVESDRNAPSENNHQIELKIPMIQSIKVRKKGQLRTGVIMGTLVGLTGGMIRLAGKKKTESSPPKGVKPMTPTGGSTGGGLFGPLFGPGSFTFTGSSRASKPSNGGAGIEAVAILLTGSLVGAIIGNQKESFAIDGKMEIYQQEQAALRKYVAGN